MLSGRHLQALRAGGTIHRETAQGTETRMPCVNSAELPTGNLRALRQQHRTCSLRSVHAYNTQHLRVLDSLATVKTIILITDIPSSSQLILRLFTTCFDLLSVSRDNVSKNTEYNITLLLSCIIEECQGLPTEVVDIILAQFLRADPRIVAADEKNKKANGLEGSKTYQSSIIPSKPSPAYTLAVNLCNGPLNHMARYVSQYFSNVIVDASAYTDHSKTNRKPKAGARAAESDDEGDAMGLSEADLRELGKAHRLLRELWRSCPDVLQNVIPQIEAELSAENLDIRLMATKAIGDLAAGIGAAGPGPAPELDPTAYPPLDLTRLDRSAAIRAAWTTSIGLILSTSAGGIGLNAQEERELMKQLSIMLLDADEKVRIAAIAAVGSFSMQDIIERLGSLGGVNEAGSIMLNLADRVKDKRPAVRKEAFALLSRMWGVATGELAAGNEAVANLLGPVPSRLFEAAYVNDLDISANIDHVLFNSLMPLGYPSIKSTHSSKDKSTGGKDDDLESQADAVRAERLLLLGGVMSSDADATKSRLGKLIDMFSGFTPDAYRTSEDLWKFAKMNDRRIHSLIRFLIAPESDYKKVFRAIVSPHPRDGVWTADARQKEIRKRLEGSAGSVAETVDNFVLRVANFFYNKSHIRRIVDISREANHSLNAAAHELIKEISTKCPSVFKSHAAELCRALEAQAPAANGTNEASALENMKACASFATKFPKEIPSDLSFLKAMTRYALQGSPPAIAKHAVTIIMAIAESKEMYAEDLLQQCVKGFKYGSPHFLTRLACISQLMLKASRSLEEHADNVFDIAINADPDAEPHNDSRNGSCLGRRAGPRVSGQDLGSANSRESTSKGLLTVPDDDSVPSTPPRSDIASSETVPASHRAHLRLTAALLLLKLSSKRGFDTLLSTMAFDDLTLVAQDTEYPIRMRFVSKVQKYLGRERLPSRFYVPVFLLAFEPSAKLKESASTWLASRCKAITKSKGDDNKAFFESTFARFLSTMAHHPGLHYDRRRSSRYSDLPSILPPRGSLRGHPSALLQRRTTAQDGGRRRQTGRE
ncbi:hypothetical protein MRB53_038194 [Persea americana]|nr:hypothetical protein MRB53_038194 [Persea americana]